MTKGKKPQIKLLLTEDLLPHKIALVALIRLYSRSIVSQALVEPVLAAVVSFLANDFSCSTIETRVIIPSLLDLLNALTHRIESDCQGISLEAAGLRLLILGELWLIDLVEDLSTFLSETHAFVVPAPIWAPEDTSCHPISSRSLLGSFLMKIVTAHKLLKFDEELLLYQAFVDYRDCSKHLCPGASKSRKSSILKGDSPLFDALIAQLDRCAGGSNITPEQVKLNTHISVLKYDLKTLLDKQVSVLEDEGTSTPPQLREIMELMALPDATTCLIQNINYNNLPSYHYIRYLENLHESNYNGAFEALHRYFDYMVSSNSKYFYHFALISRASLYHYFGELENALDVIEEAIAVARENKDNATLTYILSWLFGFLSNHPKLWEKQNFYNNNGDLLLLQFLKKKLHLVLLLLYSMSYTFETLVIISNGGSMAQYLESLLKAMYIASHDPMCIAAKSSELASSVWARIGVPALSACYARIASRLTQNRLERTEIEARILVLEYDSGNTEFAVKGMRELRAKCSDSDHALSNTMLTKLKLILVRWHLARGCFGAAARLIKILSDSDIRDHDIRNDIMLLRIRIEFALGNLPRALQQVASAMHAASASNTILIIRLNLLKCEILAKTGNHAACLILLMHLLQNACSMGFASLVAEAILVWASTLTSRGFPGDCQRVLQETMPRILASGIDCAGPRGYYELARSYAAIDEANNESTYYSQTLHYLALAVEGFRQCHFLVGLQQCLRLQMDVAARRGDKDLGCHASDMMRELELEMRAASASVEANISGPII